MKLKKTLIIFVFLSVFPLIAQAWWSAGHEVISQIAYDNLTPTAKKAVNKILHQPLDWPNATATQYIPAPKELSEYLDDYILAASWADVIGMYDKTNWSAKNIYSNMHFINIPLGFKLDTTKKAMDFNCDSIDWSSKIDNEVERSQNDNALSANLSAIKSLVTEQKNDAVEKAVALRLLIHFSGDIFQPFHTLDPIVHYKVQGKQMILDTIGANLIMFPTGLNVKIYTYHDPDTSYTILTKWHMLADSAWGYYLQIPDPTDSSYEPNGKSDWTSKGNDYRQQLQNIANNIESDYKNDKTLNDLILNHPKYKYWLVNTANNACKMVSDKYYGANVLFFVEKNPKTGHFAPRASFINDDYAGYDNNTNIKSIVSQQLYISGMHLAYILNTVFDPQYKNKAYKKYVTNNIKDDASVKTLFDLVNSLSYPISSTINAHRRHVSNGI